MPRLPRRRAHLLPAIAVAALLVGCSDRPVPTAARGTPVSAAVFAAGPAHISGRFSGSQTRTPIQGSPGYFRTDQVASGVIDQAGPATVVWAVPMIHLDALRREVSILTPSWTITMTLAGGQQIFARYTFPASTVHFTPLGDYTAITTLDVTGGTGWYATATGHGTGVITGNAFTKDFTVRLEGVVAIPAP